MDLTAADYDRFLDEATRSRMGMGAEEFRRAYAAGELDDSDPDVPMLVGLLWIGQNGDRSAAA